MADHQPVPEDDCVICGKWPARDRWALRETLEWLPLDDVPICDECAMAWGRNIGLVRTESPGPERKH